MIQISREEAKGLRKAVPEAVIKRTVNRYYVEDTRVVRNALRRMSPKAVAIRC